MSCKCELQVAMTGDAITTDMGIYKEYIIETTKWEHNRGIYIEQTAYEFRIIQQSDENHYINRQSALPLISTVKPIT